MVEFLFSVLDTLPNSFRLIFQNPKSVGDALMFYGKETKIDPFGLTVNLLSFLVLLPMDVCFFNICLVLFHELIKMQSHGIDSSVNLLLVSTHHYVFRTIYAIA